MILFKRAWEILWKNRKTYLAFNVLYYGVILVLMVYALFNAPLQDQLLTLNQSTYISGALGLMHKTAIDQEVLVRLGFTFLSNMLSTGYGEISLPSFFIPFSGILVGLYRAALLGIAYSPFHPSISPIIIPHLPTLVLEGQAYILAMLGAFIHGRAMIWPGTIGQTSRWKAYVEGVRQTGTLYIIIIPVLFAASCYGVIETLLLMR